MVTDRLRRYGTEHTEAAPLAVFRVLFGLMMLASIIRFGAMGWIDQLYVQPQFFFPYFGFEWVRPLSGWTYMIFLLCGLSSLSVALGYKYRLSIILFFLSFTYIELMDKTTYLNHYYFISLVSFLMIFLPVHATFSLDAWLDPKKAFQFIPRWTIDAVKLMLGIVYFYAGLAKLNSDWLFHAMPLKIWLPYHYDFPLLGELFQQSWFLYVFSWAGAIYDLMIPFLMINRRTRVLGFMMIVGFHMITGALFPIGMFPYIMIASSLIFFDSSLHIKIINSFLSFFKLDPKVFFNDKYQLHEQSLFNQSKLKLILLFFALQLLIPFRYLLYPGELFWTEEGYPFSWRVMLMEKSGKATFKVVDGQSNKWLYVDNTVFLTSFQEKQMATQPDFILTYAHFLKEHYEGEGWAEVEVYVDSFVALNGRISKRYIDPSVDLTKEKESFGHKTWILPFEDEIKGL
ncbi:HTTM domain-containing protein [Reichenbachiella ulvae]|uniref:HTTM domain-containing protein n=1 Tax=Reichenbachiella ulvae TaxID=2980104 RepID=A0ABT3CR04_9BACT|nr:HTTM domain-containing protein [Reichenbachiella ulvae]MCV9385914.1 HTTM domain-containing protein [Reichenbachiella ulvae]